MKCFAKNATFKCNAVKKKKKETWTKQHRERTNSHNAFFEKRREQKVQRLSHFSANLTAMGSFLLPDGSEKLTPRWTQIKLSARETTWGVKMVGVMARHTAPSSREFRLVNKNMWLTPFIRNRWL